MLCRMVYAPTTEMKHRGAANVPLNSLRCRFVREPVASKIDLRDEAPGKKVELVKCKCGMIYNVCVYKAESMRLRRLLGERRAMSWDSRPVQKAWRRLRDGLLL